jgi:hypothetical protein
MPAAQRFGFMHKYSADEYSMEMGRAVDMWAECAVLVLCVVEVNKLLGKLKVGTLCLDKLYCSAVPGVAVGSFMSCYNSATHVGDEVSGVAHVYCSIL